MDNWGVNFTTIKLEAFISPYYFHLVVYLGRPNLIRTDQWHGCIAREGATLRCRSGRSVATFPTPWGPKKIPLEKWRFYPLVN